MEPPQTHLHNPPPRDSIPSYLSSPPSMKVNSPLPNQYIQTQTYLSPRRIAEAEPIQRQRLQPQIHSTHASRIESREGCLPKKPNPIRRVQRVPYETQFVDYEIQQVMTNVWVPIEKKRLFYYAVEHITQYVPKQIEDYRLQMVPEEEINMRVQYVPVQRRVVHLPQDERHSLPISPNDYFYCQQGIAQGRPSTSQLNIPGYEPYQGQRSTLSYSRRTNYVTSDNYVPNFTPQIHDQKPRETHLSNSTSRKIEEPVRYD